MNIRQPSAPNFYPGNIGKQVDSFLEGYTVPDDVTIPIAGIVPHAGWMFSGKTAAKVFASFLRKNNPQTIILLGAVHNVWKVSKNAVYAEGAWYTPLGEIRIEHDVADKILSNAPDLFESGTDAHEGEHSLEVQLPFTKYLMPDTSIVPIAVLPDAHAQAVGEVLAEIIKSEDEKVIVVGSTDLTHYGRQYGFAPAGTGDKAKQWMYENDMSIVNKALNLDAASIVDEAAGNHNACGSGALAAVVAFAKKCGAEKGILIDYVTSYDIMPDPVFSMAVGYAGIVFN